MKRCILGAAIRVLLTDPGRCSEQEAPESMSLLCIPRDTSSCFLKSAAYEALLLGELAGGGWHGEPQGAVTVDCGESVASLPPRGGGGVAGAASGT